MRKLSIISVFLLISLPISIKAAALYARDADDIYAIDPVTGSHQIQSFLNGGALAYGDGTLFAGADGDIYSINLQTGDETLLSNLNGSALALPRIFAALTENNQTDGGIKIPEVLQKYTGFDIID